MNETESSHHHGPKKTVLDLLDSAARLAGRDAQVCFGRHSKQPFYSARENEVIRLSAEMEAPPSPSEIFGEGGEHRIFGSATLGRLVKHTLPGRFGQIMDEAKLLDPRTFQNKPRLKMRYALPSEYLRRWAVMTDVFGMRTEYIGKVTKEGGEPQMAIEQPFIVEDENLPATKDDLIEFFTKHGFDRVDDDHLVNPEVHGVTWYRQRDGILVTDAHARNFRRDMDGVIIPVDLVIALVPPGASTLLPAATRLWQPSDDE